MLGASHASQITIYYGPMWVTEAFIIYCVLACRNRLATASQSLRITAQRSSSTSQALRMQKQLYWRLSGYPWLLILAWGPASVRRMWQMAAPNSLEELGIATWAAGIQITFSSLAGLFNFFFFVATMGVRERHPAKEPENASGLGGSGEGSAVPQDSGKMHVLRSLCSNCSDAHEMSALTHLTSPRSGHLDSLSSATEGVNLAPLALEEQSMASLSLLAEEAEAGRVVQRPRLLSRRALLTPTCSSPRIDEHPGALQPTSNVCSAIVPSSAACVANNI